ncbi:hypothetical protein [Amycolatopsis sp. NPDC051071]|uniref:hypothetical protein n=1 Tax=Amycolatopsis sp. NPDC051071 TaxID=3154637 RepID=UPI00344AC300
MSKSTSMVFLVISGILLVTFVVLAVFWPTTLNIVMAAVLALLFAYSALSVKRRWEKLR